MTHDTKARLAAIHTLLRNAENIFYDIRVLPERIAEIYQKEEFADWSNESRLAFVKQLLRDTPSPAFLSLAKFVLNKHPELESYYKIITSSEENLEQEWIRFGKEVLKHEI